jgi:hypothetical protein
MKNHCPLYWTWKPYCSQDEFPRTLNFHLVHPCHPSYDLSHESFRYLRSIVLFPCPHCCTTKYTLFTQQTLSNHINHIHSQHRTQSNLDLILASYPHATNEQWLHSLQWLQNHSALPPTFTTNLWRHLRTSTILELKVHVLQGGVV